MTALNRLSFVPPPGIAGRANGIARARVIPNLDETK